VDRDRRQQILDAAFSRFAQYGFRNTSIDDIARATGISRPLVYHHFANKEEVFRALAGQLHAQVIEQAVASLDGPGDVAAQVAGALAAKLGVLETIQASEHHDELMETTSRLAGDLATAATERFDAALAKRLRAARRNGELPTRTGEVPITQLVRLLRESASGIAKAATDDAWRPRVEALTRLALGT
jgi:TetR/AcrR family transcriptional regulator, mexJK operon transcriptional repressor